MLYGMYNSAAGALVQDSKVATHSNNMSNANTTAFHRNYMTFRDRRPASEEGRNFEFKNEMLDKMNGGVFIQGTPFDRSHGPIKQTGRKLDVALKGEGFFRVSNGKETFFTRAGNFKRNQDGELVTANGKYNVLSREGNSIELQGMDKIQINSEGTIYRDKEEVAQLSTVNVEDMSNLEKRGENLFQFRGENGEAVPFEGKVMQGHIEQSNVQAVKELTGMIRAQRIYDQNMSAIEQQDTTLERAINNVGRVS